MQIVAGGVPLGEDFYDGRLKSVDDLKIKLIKNDVLLIGPRRTGKTSVIKEYLRQEKLADKNFYSIFIDLEKAQNLYEFYFLILRELYQTCKKWKLLANEGKDFLKGLSSLCSEIFDGGIDSSALLGLPPGSSLNIKFPKFQKEEQEKLKILSAKLRSELDDINENITIVLDEFPELIWKFGQTEEKELQFESRKLQTQFLLEGLRSLRQEGQSRTKRIVLAGSVNLPNTLEYLGLEHTINDLDRLKIPYLTSEESFDLMSQLIAGNDINIYDITFFEESIKCQLGICSPFYAQIFAESLIQLIVDRGGDNTFSNDDIKLCYKQTLSSEKGPRYLKDRIKKYYSKNIDQVEYVLRILALEQFQRKMLITECQLSEMLADKFKMPRSEISELMAKMCSDDLIQFLGDGNDIGFRSQILCNFWNYTFIDTKFWYDS